MVSLPALPKKVSFPPPPLKELFDVLPVIVSAKPLPVTFSNWLTVKFNGRGAVPLTVTTPLVRFATVPVAGAALAPLRSTVSPSRLLPMMLSTPIRVSDPSVPLFRTPKAPNVTTLVRVL